MDREEPSANKPYNIKEKSKDEDKAVDTVIGAACYNGGAYGREISYVYGYS